MSGGKEVTESSRRGGSSGVHLKRRPVERAIGRRPCALKSEEEVDGNSRALIRIQDEELRMELVW